MSAAAVFRNGHVEVCTLGVLAPTLPSVVFLRDDGGILVGEAAERRGLADPSRVAREFKRRLGDPTPLFLGGTPYGAETLTGELLRAIVQMAAEREGEQPALVVLTHPVGYGPYKLDMLRAAARQAGIGEDRLRLVSEPVAAAVSYSSRQRIDLGDTFAVYDFGGGTFDAAAVRRTEDGFDVLGLPEGLDRFGGIDIDATIMEFVDDHVGGAISAMNERSSAVMRDVSALRDECRNAKETLSFDTQATIRLPFAELPRSVDISRRDVARLIRPRIVETVEVLRRTVQSAGLQLDQISRILLVGGSSRIPLVAQLIQELTERPVFLDAHPKHAIATGAAIIGGQELTPDDDADKTIAHNDSTPPIEPATPAANVKRDSLPTKTRWFVGLAIVLGLALEFFSLVTFIVLLSSEHDPNSWFWLAAAIIDPALTFLVVRRLIARRGAGQVATSDLASGPDRVPRA